MCIYVLMILCVQEKAYKNTNAIEAQQHNRRKYPGRVSICLCVQGKNIKSHK